MTSNYDVMTEERPSLKLYRREDPRWREAAEDGEYGFAYMMGELDAKAGLNPLGRGEIPIGYGEGYRDGYADWSDA